MGNSNAVAELAFGMMVASVRNFYDGSSGSELKDKVIGLHGFGQVARHMWRLAQGFGMKAFAFDPFLTPEAIEKAGEGATNGATIKAVGSYKELFEKAHFVSLHIPCTPETKGSIGYAELMSMPKGGTLINTARAEVVDEEGLLKAFTERADLKYLADVQPMDKTLLEKLNGADKGWSASTRAFVTPKKMGAQTSEANNNAGIAAAKQVVAFFEEGDVRFQVNKPGQKF